MPPLRAAALLLGLSLVACRHETAVVATGERFHGRGQIVGLSADTATIHHERLAAVRGYDGKVAPMEPMTMPFARAQTSFAGLAVDDAVEFEFTVSYDEAPTLRLASLVKLPAGTQLDVK